MKKKVLGISLDSLDSSALDKELDSLLTGDGSNLIVTPNPEIILNAQKDPEYFRILNSASLSLADGFGVVLAGRVRGQKIPRVTGSDTTVRFLERHNKDGIKVAVLLWDQSHTTVDEVLADVPQKYPNIEFLVLAVDRTKPLPAETIKKLNDFAPAALFAGLGSPWQERLLHDSLPELKSVRLAFAVGGTFDFIIGKVKRAPGIFKKLGLEWVWRVIKQPKRLFRTFRSVFVFLTYVLLERVGFYKVPGEDKNEEN